jgi:mono/diheme cytochrome c family protein
MKFAASLTLATVMSLSFTRLFLLAGGVSLAAAVVGTGQPAAAAVRPMLHVEVPAAPPVNKYVEVCAVCHQATGLGLEGAFPPLAGSEWLNGRPEIPIAIVLHGLQGPITVKGKAFNGAMMAWGAAMTDDDIAGTLTYARSQWGNRAAAVTPAQVRAVRARFASRTTPWSAAELKAIK